MAAYLDWNATAPLRPEARVAMVGVLDDVGNPSSVHGFGRKARRLVENARESVARLCAAAPASVIFTGSGTEANVLAMSRNDGERIAVLATEHASVLGSVSDQDHLIPVDDQGVINLGSLHSLLKSTKIGRLSVQWVNNETGVIQPLAEIVRIARQFDVAVHCDAVQAAGRLPLDFPTSGLAMMSISAHKIGGPQGVGALIVRDGFSVRPVLRGGGQERRQRAGTENVAGIVGFGAASAAAYRDLADYSSLAKRRDRLAAALCDISPDATIFGAQAPRVANTLCIARPGYRAESQLMAFDLAGFAVSSGAACSSGKVGPSHVLAAMGVDTALAECAIRISFGAMTSDQDLQGFVKAWAGAGRRAA